jgi:MFS transporter, AAHS family, 4-hydroxybenzoate transporter
MDPRIHSFRLSLDKRPLTIVQLRIIVAAILLAVMDGYDVQIIGYVAPILSGLWHIDHKAFGLVFGAGLVGLAVGPLIFSPLADKCGCRPVLIGCTILYALGTLATTMADSWNMLLVLRLVTGLGLGGVLPCTVAVVSDFAPTRARNFTIAVCSSGFAIGGSLGGFVAAEMIQRFGWQSVFWVGGFVPLVMLPVLLIWFPESLPRLLADARLRPQLDRIVAQLVPGWNPPQTVDPKITTGMDRFPVAALFDGGFAIPTLLIWTIFLCSLLLLYFFVNWIPTVLHQLGQPLEVSNRAAAVFQLAGIFGGFSFNAIADRSGKFEWVLALAFTAAAVSCSLFGALAGTSLPFVLISAAVTGFCVVGALGACISFAGTYYPARTRATGIGWAMGVGRLGSILGPVVGGVLLTLDLTSEALFRLFSAPALLAVVCCLLLKRLSAGPMADEDAERTDITSGIVKDAT